MRSNKEALIREYKQKEEEMAKKEVFEDQIDLIKKVKDRKKKIEKEIEKDAIQQTVSRQMSLITDNANVY